VPEDAGGRGFCALCGRQSDAVVLREGRHVGRLCACGVVYIDPFPTVREADPTVDLHIRDYYVLPARLRIDWVQRFVPAGRLVDVGCGDGATVAEALRRGYRVEAVEPNAACAAHVASTFGIRVDQAMIEETTLPRGAYDVVFQVDLLSHFRDPVRALTSMASLLKPGGFLCFEVGLFGGLARPWYPWMGRPGFPAHLWLYSEAAVRALLTRAALRPVEIRKFTVGPSAVLSSLLYRLLPGTLRAVPASTGRAPVGSPLQRLYARLHYLIRYRLGAHLAMPGPQTALVAARASAAPAAGAR
jgi:SAM-dependent methyltransferase